MFSLFPFLAWSLEIHNPDQRGIELNDHWGGILFIVLGILFMFGPVTSSTVVNITRWLRLRSEERPASGFERFVAVVACLGVGVYLLTRPA